MSNLFSLLGVSRAAKWMATTDLRAEVTHHSQDLMCISFHTKGKEVHPWVFLHCFLVWLLDRVVYWILWVYYMMYSVTYSPWLRSHIHTHILLIPTIQTEQLDSSSSLQLSINFSYFTDCISRWCLTCCSHFVLCLLTYSNTLGALSMITFRFHLKREKLKSYERQSLRKTISKWLEIFGVLRGPIKPSELVIK